MSNNSNMNAWNNSNENGISVSGVPNEGSGKTSEGIPEGYLVAIGSRSARFRRKNGDKIFIIVLLILLLILLIIVIIISVFYHKEKNRNVCETRECIRSAANLLLSMNQSANPCEDFFDYACGNWAEDHPQPDFSVYHDWFSDKQKKVERQIRDILKRNATKIEPKPLVQTRQMYKACMDKDAMDKLGMEPVVNFLINVSLPQFPTTLNLTSNISSEFDWLNVVVNIKKRMGFDVIIGFDVFPDLKNSTVKRIVFEEPSTSEIFPGYRDVDRILKILKKKRFINKKKPDKEKSKDDSDEQDDEEEDASVTDAYKDMMRETIKDVIKYSNEKLYNETSSEKMDDSINKAIDQYMEYSKLIYKTESENDTDSSNSTEYEDDIVYYTLTELQNLTDVNLKNQNLSTTQIWRPYLIKMFNGSGVQLNLDKELIMTSHYDIKSLMKILTTIQSSSILNLELFIWLQVVENFIPHTTTKLNELYTKYVKTVTQVESYVPRSVYCSSAVTSMMGMAIGYAVADKSFNDTTLPRVQRMLTNIKIAFESIVSSVTWMDLSTKRVTIEKARVMKSFIGFPEWLFEPGKLESYYEGVVSDPGKHLENMIKIKELGVSNKIKYYKRPYKFTWDTVPTEVNAYHTFQANTITVPLVMMQYPFYDLGLEALNYGSLGTILGHELTHGFDNTGRQYDKDGSMLQWWSNSTIKKFENKTKCLVKQYSDFYVPEVDDYVDGNLTLGENIADNGGLRTALRAFHMEKERNGKLPGLIKFNSEQLFFLSYGNLWCNIKSAKSLRYDLQDEHSPNHLRLRGTLQNTPEFAKAWNCPLNSTMNPMPNKRCIVF